MSPTAKGSPTKGFFINMLTRDIDIKDAILDLLDNCLDGVIRQKRGADRTNMHFYEGYQAKITIKNDSFTIEDNCGGIPLDIATEVAFRMGRDPNALQEADNNLPTVGIYGIGMKRAIFKMGKQAIVYSLTPENSFKVEIPAQWQTTLDWDFQITNNVQDHGLESHGTKIEITELNPSIQHLWSSADSITVFVDDLVKSIKETYSYIIQKGFQIFVNHVLVEYKPISLLFSDQIQPYIYKNQFQTVAVSLIVGLYSPLPSDELIDSENEGNTRSSQDAGWTVICNDRVVLYNNKDHLTGWGEAGVPRYHTQFIAIRGVVAFESNNPEDLPMTTTKRGIDLTSPIYYEVKNKMREGLKVFTNYTNKWKGRLTEEQEFSSKAQLIEISTTFIQNEEKLRDLGIPSRQTFSPNLPKPKVERPVRRIIFSKPEEDVKLLVTYFFDNPEAEIAPSIIGELCFDEVLKKVKE